MAKTIKVVPIEDIEYKGTKRLKDSEAFDMDEETAKVLIPKGIVKDADTSAKTKAIATEAKE